jgi:benzoyl-CoA reductase/2-hydroxyglutaryl-CoA dehydratase subunit BcrC/BadD/HgdB
VAYLGLDTPVELIAAAGFQPIQIVATPTEHGADEFGEGAGHPLLRGIVSELTRGEWGDVRRLVISTTPSVYVGLYAFLYEAKRAGAGFEKLDVHLFDLSRAGVDAASPLRVCALKELKAKLEEWSDAAISDEAIRAAIRQHDQVRESQRRVQALRGEGKLSGVEALQVFGAREALSAAAYVRLLAELCAEVASRKSGGARTIYSGTATASVDIYEKIEASGALIVADDQDYGSRAIGDPIGHAADPLAALAAHYFKRAPSPARWDTRARVAYLTELARRDRAERVVFHFAPWDHPPAWDYPAQRRALEAMGVSCDVLETGNV